MRLTRVLMWSLVPLLVVAMAAPLADVFSPTAIPSLRPVGASAWVAVGLGLVALGCATTLERGKQRRLMISGLIAAAVAQVIWTGALWLNGLSQQQWYAVSTFATPVTGWAVLTMLVGVLIRPRMDSSMARFWRGAALVLLSLLALHTVLGITLYPLVERRQVIFPGTGPFVMSSTPGFTNSTFKYMEVMMRLGGALAISLSFTVMGLVFTIYLPRMRGDPLEPESVPRPFHATCPRCGQRQQLQTAGDECAACGLRIKVTPT